MKRPYEVKIFNLTCFSADKNILVNATLTADGSLDVNVNLLKDYPEVHFIAEIYLDSGSGKYEMEILNKTVIVCRIFRQPRYEPLIQIIYKMVLPHSNYPTECPIRKNTYSVKGFRINTELLPPMLPEKNVLMFFNVAS
ncbi:hypothetical protein Bhyg_05829 [Pseudolycoriella hygida]|uniref:Uncharacterized protein n=1 Tax=Pseudolycoriella hygida TaxID=35572 RepID=A0A9Q0N110_9DIPT|nr:hypothetical protein Bhyg_05829 [Pseudolycoriella hygida]